MLNTRLLIAALMAAILAGCGAGEETDTPAEPSGTSEISGAFKQALEEASSPRRGDFPATRGRTMRELADTLAQGGQVGLATSVFTVGDNRLAFGLIDDENKLIYGKTAVYVGSGENAPARGPFLAPADSLVTDPRFRSQTAAAETDTIAAIYSAEISLEKPGAAAILVVTNAGGQQFGVGTGITVQRSDPVASVGERAPDVATDTLASLGGNEELACTREPIDTEMHDTSLEEVLGKRPVALIMATPAFCESRVCGPVVDIAAQLRYEYGDDVEFIHQEVYVDNDLQKGLRPALQAFDLPSEPWLFTIDRSGRIAARLEGSFGIDASREAVEAAL